MALVVSFGDLLSWAQELAAISLFAVTLDATSTQLQTAASEAVSQYTSRSVAET